MLQDPFGISKSYIRQVKPEIEDFGRRCESFINKDGIEVFSRYGKDPGHTVIGFRLIRNIPEELERCAFKIVSELRSILDKGVGSAAKLLGDPFPRYRNFPFAEDIASLKGQLRSGASGKGPYRGIPRELHRFFEELSPCRHAVWGRHYVNLLWGLGNISNPTKHDPTLTVEIHSDGINLVGAMDGRGSVNVVNTWPIWNESRTECEVCIIDGISEIDIGLNLVIGLPRTEGFPRGVSAGSVLNDTLHIVDGVILGLEAETDRILRERASH